MITYKCRKDYIMECAEFKGVPAFIEGRTYRLNENRTGKSELFSQHDLSEEKFFDEYFEPVIPIQSPDADNTERGESIKAEFIKAMTDNDDIEVFQPLSWLGTLIRFLHKPEVVKSLIALNDNDDDAYWLMLRHVGNLKESCDNLMHKITDEDFKLHPIPKST